MGTNAEATTGAGRWRPLVLVAAVAVAYLNSLGCAFQFDDQSNIDSPVIRSPSLSTLLAHPRPAAAAALAFNYAFNCLDPLGYHFLNVVVHAAAAVILFDLVRETLRLPGVSGWSETRAGNVALAAALVWAVHPLNTQAVTYIIQRMESLMGMFYLLSLYALLRGSTAPTPGSARAWYVGAVVACGLAMGSKQVGVTIPAVALLYDRWFLAGTFRGAVARRWPVHLGTTACAVVLVASEFASLTATPVGNGPSPTVGFGISGLTAADYARSQPGVILYYLRLAVWPRPLCLDYRWPVATTSVEVVPPAIGLALLLTVTVWAVWRRPKVGFLPAAFFLILAPTSSVVPVADLAFEHRMYLPLAALVVLVVLAADAGLRAAAAPGWAGPAGVAGVATVFGVMTHERNEDYRTPLSLWADTAAKRPENARAWHNLGVSLTKELRYDEAVAPYEIAYRLEPGTEANRFDLATAYNSRGMTREAAGRDAEAFDDFRAAYRVAPEVVEVKYNLGQALIRAGQFPEAVERLREVAAARPDHPASLRLLGIALVEAGRPAEAVPCLERAAADPREQVAREWLAKARGEGGR